MAPTYRNRDRRQNRPGVDHHELEGIPVRHWRRDFVTVAPPPSQDNATGHNDIWAVELPHGMPKDSHLLPQHSQDLLRAARSGKIYKRPAPSEEEEADPEIILSDKPEKKDDDMKDRGFTARSWKQIPRHLEGPDTGFLAKRRKGLVTGSSKAVVAVVPTVTKATVKRIDAAGNEYVEDVVVAQGQQVEGEVLSQVQIPDPSAPIDPTLVQPTPPRRRPTQKKKAKGPGRGRKKKPAAPTSAPQDAPADGSVLVAPVEGAVGPDGIKLEADPTATPANNEDTEMGDGSAANSDDEDGEDGDEGNDDDDDEGSVDMQDSPSKQPHNRSLSPISAPPIPPIPTLDQPDTLMGGTDLSPIPPKLRTERSKSEGKSGSPLKQVALTISAVPSPVEGTLAGFTDIASKEEQTSPPSESVLEAVREGIQPEIAALAPPTLPHPPPEPTNVELAAAVELRQEEEEEEKMLFDIVENADHAQIGAPAFEEPTSHPVPTTEAHPSVALLSEPPQNEMTDAEAFSEPNEQTKEPEPAPLPAPLPEESVLGPEPMEEEDDDDYPDLLGGLEKSLKTPEARGETPVAAPGERTPAVELMEKKDAERREEGHESDGVEEMLL